MTKQEKIEMLEQRVADLESLVNSLRAHLYAKAPKVTPNVPPYVPQPWGSPWYPRPPWVSPNATPKWPWPMSGGYYTTCRAAA